MKAPCGPVPLYLMLIREALLVLVILVFFQVSEAVRGSAIRSWFRRTLNTASSFSGPRILGLPKIRPCTQGTELGGSSGDGDARAGEKSEKPIVDRNKFSELGSYEKDSSEQSDSTSSELDSGGILLLASVILVAFGVKYVRG